MASVNGSDYLLLETDPPVENVNSPWFLLMQQRLTWSGESKAKLVHELATRVCTEIGVRYDKLAPIQRLFITHYRCEKCGIVSLSELDGTNFKRPRCGKCGCQISPTRSGKYRVLRRRIMTLMLSYEREVRPIVHR